MVDCVPVAHWRRLVLSHVWLRYVEPGHHHHDHIELSLTNDDNGGVDLVWLRYIEPVNIISISLSQSDDDE